MSNDVTYKYYVLVLRVVIQVMTLPYSINVPGVIYMCQRGCMFYIGALCHLPYPV